MHISSRSNSTFRTGHHGWSACECLQDYGAALTHQHICMVCCRHIRVLQAHRIGALIGPGGSNIKQLTRETATHVNIPKERSTAFNIDVTANSPADLARAMEIINDVLNGGQEGGTSQPGQEGWLTVQGIQQMRAHTASRY